MPKKASKNSDMPPLDVNSPVNWVNYTAEYSIDDAPPWPWWKKILNRILPWCIWCRLFPFRSIEWYVDQERKKAKRAEKGK